LFVGSIYDAHDELRQELLSKVNFDKNSKLGKQVRKLLSSKCITQTAGKRRERNVLILMFEKHDG
jgi:hypothetical protein